MAIIHSKKEGAKYFKSKSIFTIIYHYSCKTTTHLEIFQRICYNTYIEKGNQSVWLTINN